MSSYHQNDLLAEYNFQVEDVLSEDEKKMYDEFSFYNVYEVEIGGTEVEGGPCCTIFMLGGICFILFCLPDPLLEVGCVCNTCGCCVSECGGEVGECCKDFNKDICGMCC